jgi:hypothetical protein
MKDEKRGQFHPSSLILHPCHQSSEHQALIVFETYSQNGRAAVFPPKTAMFGGC